MVLFISLSIIAHFELKYTYVYITRYNQNILSDKPPVGDSIYTCPLSYETPCMQMETLLSIQTLSWNAHHPSSRIGLCLHSRFLKHMSCCHSLRLSVLLRPRLPPEGTRKCCYIVGATSKANFAASFTRHGQSALYQPWGRKNPFLNRKDLSLRFWLRWAVFPHTLHEITIEITFLAFQVPKRSAASPNTLCLHSSQVHMLPGYASK